MMATKEELLADYGLTAEVVKAAVEALESAGRI